MPGPALRPRRRARAAVLAALAGVGLAGCVIPDWNRFEGVGEPARIAVGQTTRDEVRARLGAPTAADTPRLYVYEWEKARALVLGYFNAMAPLGHQSTRALFVFDDDGRVARAEVSGIGQDGGRAASAAPQAPLVAAVTPLAGACARGTALRVHVAAPGPTLLVHAADGLRVCRDDAPAALGTLSGPFIASAVSADGRRLATLGQRHDDTLVLREMPTLAPLRTLGPAPSPGVIALLRWGAGVSLSADGRRAAVAVADGGVTVHDTDSGQALLHRDGHWDPTLSPDGRWLASKAESGLHLTEVDSGRDVAVRPLARYPYRVAQNPALARQLIVKMGTVAFSADGRRLAVATCAHAEVWDLAAATPAPAWTQGLVDAFVLPFSAVHGVCAASAAFAADGRTLAVANEGSVVVRDLARRASTGTYALPVATTEVDFDADLSQAAFVADGRVQRWRVGDVRGTAATR